VDIKDRLDDNDFAVLKRTKSFLQALYNATLFTEGHYVTLDRVLSTIEWVLKHFERGKVEYAEDLFFSPYINIGWIKLNKYYGLTDKSPAYVSAVVLDPAQK
jgi:hypothetical protein